MTTYNNIHTYKYNIDFIRETGSVDIGSSKSCKRHPGTVQVSLSCSLIRQGSKQGICTASP